MSLTLKEIELRKTGIGGSDAGVICGFDTKTPLELYMEKVENLKFEFSEETEERMLWGNLLEPIIMDQYSKKIGIFLEKPKNSIQHKDYPWMRANLDFICPDKPIIGEIKTCAFMKKDEWGDDGSDMVPMKYLSQMVHNRICAESFYGHPIEEVHMPVFNTNMISKTYIYRKDEANEANLIKLEEIFWKEHVEKRIPPEPKTFSDVRLMHPVSDDSWIVARNEHIELLEELKMLDAREKGISSRQEEIKKELIKYRGNGAFLSDEEGNILATFKNSSPRSYFNSKKFQEENKDLYEKYLIKKEVNRAFRFSRKG